MMCRPAQRQKLQMTPQPDERLTRLIPSWIASRRSIFAGRIPAPSWALGLLKSWRWLVGGWQIRMNNACVRYMAERGELVNTQHRCLCWVLRAVFDSIYKDMMIIMSWALIF